MEPLSLKASLEKIPPNKRYGTHFPHLSATPWLPLLPLLPAPSPFPLFCHLFLLLHTPFYCQCTPVGDQVDPFIHSRIHSTNIFCEPTVVQW